MVKVRVGLSSASHGMGVPKRVTDWRSMMKLAMLPGACGSSTSTLPCVSLSRISPYFASGPKAVSRRFSVCATVTGAQPGLGAGGDAAFGQDDLQHLGVRIEQYLALFSIGLLEIDGPDQLGLAGPVGRLVGVDIGDPGALRVEGGQRGALDLGSLARSISAMVKGAVSRTSEK